MKKLTNLKVILILSIITLIVVFSCIGYESLFGSKTDWLTQHVIFPEYFRTLFYHTGDLTPNLALNLGAGQNIYNYSYYGLMSPLILLSYALPFIKMINYIMILNIIIVIASGFLLYKWLTQNKINNLISFVASILFVLTGSLIFQAHRQMMFMDYMPFLIMGLISIDYYYKNNKKTLYIISIFLMIMTSYYFSIGGLITLGLYGLYKYLMLNKTVTFKSFMVALWKIIYPMLIAVLMASILLIPTAYSLIASRSSIGPAYSWASLLWPYFDSSSLFYNSYGLGFTSIAGISLMCMFINASKEKKVLSIGLMIVLVIPIIVYILNGMLYLRYKVLIPFAPLICLVIALFLEAYNNKKIELKWLYILPFSLIILCLGIHCENYLFYIDIIFTSTALILFYKSTNKKGLYIILLFIALFACIVTNKADNYVSKKAYNETYSAEQSKLIDSILKKDTQFYRFNNLTNDYLTTVNKIYNDRYYQTSMYSSGYNTDYYYLYNNINAQEYRNKFVMSQSNNILFQTLMGVKYIISEKDIPIGYKYIDGNKEIGLYENDNVFPLGYASSSLLSYETYYQLSYPYNQEVLLNYIVVSKDSNDIYISNLKPLDIDYAYEVDKNISIKEVDKQLIVDTSKGGVVKLNLKKGLSNKVVFVKFNVEQVSDCKDGDISIAIGQTINKLTCKQWMYFNNNFQFKYVVSSPDEIKDIDIKFSKGHFVLDKLITYSLDYNYIKDSVKKIDPFIVDSKQTKGDKILGHIDVSKDGYFATTIPFDEGYTIYVNGKKTKYEEVNNAFIGFPIKKGHYEIELNYQSKGFNYGKVGSLIGCILLGLIIIIERRRKVKK